MKIFQYDDILHAPYPNPEIEKDFPDAVLRAAQFSPFAALTGHDAAIAETARVTDRKIELDEYTQEELNRKLMFLQAHIEDAVTVQITYFIADAQKSGGQYVTKTGFVKKVREYEKEVVFADGTVIPIHDITEILMEGR